MNEGTEWLVRRYEDNDREEWNRFADSSRQATFLFQRGYMDYHRDRFQDHSLMIFHRHRLFALLPACAEDRTLWSHRGLTYGGLVTDQHATTAHVCQAFETINGYLRTAGFSQVVYKAVPHIYHRLPSDEDLYALTTVCGARIMQRHISSALNRERLRFAESRRSGLRKALAHGVTVGESQDLKAFWGILQDNLQRQYGAQPVHTLAEMELLRSRFPERIRLYLASLNGVPVGGTLIYENGQVVHTQYISASPEGKSVGALDALFHYLLNERYADVPWFDFGKSSDGDGRQLNEALIFQKEGFGGRGVCYDWYQYNL